MMSTEIKKMNCINCPMGCALTVEINDGTIGQITGNTCPRGITYAQQELTAPKRMLTATVRTQDGALPLLPVVSKEALPKNKVLDCAAFLRGVTAVMPVRTGDVVVADILGLGVDIVASRDMAQK